MNNEVRALVEGQFLAKRVHAEAIGYTIGNNTIFHTPPAKIGVHHVPGGRTLFTKCKM